MTPETRYSRFALYGASRTIGCTKFAWSGFRSLLALAIMAVTSADPAKSFAGGAWVWAPGCCATAAEENSVKIVQNRRARMERLLGGDCTCAARRSRVECGCPAGSKKQ